MLQVLKSMHNSIHTQVRNFAVVRQSSFHMGALVRAFCYFWAYLKLWKVYTHPPKLFQERITDVPLHVITYNPIPHNATCLCFMNVLKMETVNTTKMMSLT